MKISFTSVVLSVMLASGGRSAPASRARTNSNTSSRQMSQANGQAFGAAYFITNEPTGNLLIAADIASNGKLTLRRAIDTGGLGAHGVTDPIGPDPLFAQGSVKASSTGNIVATVNPGSNTLSVFAINPNDPSNLQMIGKPVGSGGEFPMSVTINKAGNTVCALNGGAINGVGCFSVNQKSGLVPIANTVRSIGLNQTTPPSGPAGSASHIIFSEDNSQLIASVKGVPPTPGFLAIWDVAADGSLSADFKSVAPQAGGLLPFSMTVIAGKNALLATDAGLGFDIFDLGVVANTATDSSANATAAVSVNATATVSGNATAAVSGNATAAAVSGNATAAVVDRSSANAIAGQSATCWSSFSPKTGNFFLTDIGTSTITEVNVDANLNGTIVKQYPQTAGSATIDNDVATINGNDFLYVLASNATSIDVLSLPAPGKASSLQKVDIAGPAKSAGITISANNLQGMTTFVRK